MEYTGASLIDARDWAPCGCVDMQICGKRMAMYSVPHTNNLKIFELVMNNGVNPVTGDKLMDSEIDFETATYEEIEREYSRMMHHIIAREEEYWNAIMLVHNDLGLVHPIMSALLDDCLEKGKHAYEGGCRYNDPAYVISCGQINVANSLSAIKKNVFEEKRFTLKELKEAIAADFEGYDSIRKALLDAPKYGNDDDYVDDIVIRLYDEWASAATQVTNWVGEKWQPSTLSVTTQVLLGKACGASPDGRKAKDFLADGALSAFPGTDMEGPFIKLNDAYFKLGGYQIQYNIVDRNMLLDAQEHPENYTDLMVRVAGFTARFIDLGPDVQRQVIERTEFEAL